MSTENLQTVSFVRTDMVQSSPPPKSEVGLIKWMKDNLFSSILNTVLTLASILVVYVCLSHVLPWAFNGVWVAESLTDCRAIRDETLGFGVSSACWAVLSDRWHQLLFGFYPNDQYWRPVLALVVFLIGVAPVLFPALPRQAYLITLSAPFLCVWLVWGGPIAMPIALALGFVIGAIVYKALSTLNTLLAIITCVVVPLIYWLFFMGLAQGILEIVTFDSGLQSVESREIGGFTLSIIIGLSAIVLSLPIGILLALARQSDLFFIKTCSVVFIEVIRGVPLIVWLFSAQLLLNYFLPAGSSFDLALRVIIMVTLFSSAYIAEVIRGGLAALPKGQYEGADSLGLNYWQSMRYIILPQALKISIPGIVNTFIGLFKDTTLVVFIGLFDPIGISNAVRASTNWNGIYWELYIFIGLMFFIFCYSMGRYSLYLENKLQRGHN